MAELAAEAARLLRMREKDILSLRLLRRSVDAREEVRLVYTVEVAVKEESAILRRARSRKISRAAQAPAYTPPSPLPAPAVPPVVVGAGPAGLFAALVLAQAGLRPILLERGRPVERRKADVERFWATGELDLTSNVQFGEGGAGAFSDGKLNTGTRDPRHRFILETLVSCGAPEDILIDAKPHVGTDYLHTVLVNLRRRLLELGTDIRFESRLADLDIRDGALRGITAEGPEGVYTLPCSHLLLCPGHSARDTFAMLHKRGVPMEAKPFAVGVRIEHRQADCDAAQYRQYAGHPGLLKRKGNRKVRKYRCVAVLLPKEDPISVQRLPGGVDIEAVRPQPGCHGGADGGGRLGKADDQPGLRVLGGHLVPQGTHHLQSRRGAHRDVLGLQGIDQQVAPLGVVVSLGDPQRVCGRIWVHCGTLPSSCHEIVVRL